MSDTKFKKLYWTITGEFITNMGRTWVLERRWDDAIRWLHDSLEGMNYDYIMQILSGRAKLVGDSNTEILLEKEDPEDPEIKKYKNECMFLYGGIYKRYEKHYQPYAVVRDYGPADVGAGRPGFQGHRRIINGREMYYAQNPATDLSFLLSYPPMPVPIQMQTLWKLVDRPPLWVNTHDEPQQALNEYLEYHSNLEITGYSTWFPAGEFYVPSARLFKKRTKSPQQEADDRREEEKYQQEVDEIRAKIINQTTEWIKIMAKGIEYLIPRAPFEHWALARTAGRHLAMPWEPISPPNFKMYNDDPFHTDWVIGAGIDPDIVYSSEKNKELDQSIYNKMREIQSEKLNFECAVLNGAGKTEGIVVHPEPNKEVMEGSVIVIPAASADYYIPMVAACSKGRGAVITETGGRLCHLANEARKLNVKIIRVENALSLFPEETQVIVDCDRGKAHVSSSNISFLVEDKEYEE